MKIERHAPVARGVSHLMYVGDDVATNPVVPSVGTTEKVIGVLAAINFFRSRGLTKAVSGAVAAVIGYRWAKAS